MFAPLFRVPVCAGGWSVAHGEICGFAKTSPWATVQPLFHSVDFAIMKQNRGTCSGCFCGLLLRRAGAGCFCVGLVRLVGCPFARCGVVSASQAFLYSLRPPTQPTNRQTTTRNTSGGWLVPVRSLCVVSAPRAFFMLAAPTHPTARKPPRGSGRAARAAGRGCSFVAFPPLPRTLCFRPPPLFGGERCPPATPAGFLVRCRGLLAPVRFAGFCGLLLRAAFAVGGCGPCSPKGLAKHGWLCSTACHIMASPLGGAFRRGAPIPCPRRPAPPNPWRAAFALPARCSCAPSALRLRGC